MFLPCTSSRALALRPAEAVGGQPMRWVAAPLRYLYALLRDLARGDLGCGR